MMSNAKSSSKKRFSSNRISFSRPFHRCEQTSSFPSRHQHLRPSRSSVRGLLTRSEGEKSRSCLSDGVISDWINISFKVKAKRNDEVEETRRETREKRRGEERKKDALTISVFLSFFSFLCSFFSIISLTCLLLFHHLSLVDERRRNIYKYIFLFRSTSSTSTNQRIRPVRINGKKRKEKKHFFSFFFFFVFLSALRLAFVFSFFFSRHIIS